VTPSKVMFGGCCFGVSTVGASPSVLWNDEPVTKSSVAPGSSARSAGSFGRGFTSAGSTSFFSAFAAARAEG